MAITKPVKKDSSKNVADKFIDGAPDSTKGVIRGKRRVITAGFDPETIKKIDLASKDLGISRNAWINMVVNKALSV